MNEVLENVTTTAVWLGLLAWLGLAAFMTVQALVDRERRGRFVVFASIVAVRALLDFFHGTLPAAAYEAGKVAWMSAFVGAVLWLLGSSGRRTVIAALAPGLAGALLWASGERGLATTVAFPLGFGLCAFALDAQGGRTRGFGSGVLAATLAAMALTCATYFAVMQTGDRRLMVLGYANMAFLNAISVVFGWVHLPRELRGLAPVRIDRRHAIAYGSAMLVAEALSIAGLLTWFSWPPVLYVTANALLLSATLLLFFHHRHLLVIYADDVTLLLEERTASLREARNQLERQNENQAQLLAEQARDLEAKAEVIERQRRLELAAQTAGQAAHDMQNLIAPVLAQVTDLQARAAAHPDLREAAGRVRARLENLLELNGQMLALARRGRLDTHPLALDELARDLPGQFPGQPVTILCEEPAWLLGSWSQLSRALANLVRNALEVGPREDQRIVVRVRALEVAAPRRCHLGFLNPGSWAVVSVEDRGPGIPAHVKDHVFEPFYSTKTGTKSSGSGLGLSIVAAVVEDHRGVVDLESGPAGTTFTLWFPRVPAPARPATEEARLRGAGETVLLVEDDPATLAQYQKILEEAGYQVLVAENGQVALGTLRGDPIDLLVLDLAMPDMGGADVYLGALHEHRETRAIVHTSFVSDEMAARLRQWGVAAILAKPAGRTEFLRAVREVLTDRPALTSPPAVSN